MTMFQILDCNNVLGTCCSDYGIVNILDILRKALDILQIFVPLLLMAGVTVQLITLTINPEEKDGMKKLTNRFLATIVCFLLPTVIDIAISWIPFENSRFSLSACWEQVKVAKEQMNSSINHYIDPNGGNRQQIIDSSHNASSNQNHGSTAGIALANYARRFAGESYHFGGTWNGEEPYTPTDCSGFVQGVFRHFGISLKRSTSEQWADRSSYTLVNASDIRAGDLVMFGSGANANHVGILTGNGNEIVHAKSRRAGVTIDSDYRNVSSHAVLGIMRINGLN